MNDTNKTDTNDKNDTITIKSEWGEAARKFIEALHIDAVAGNFSLAAKVAGVNRQYMYELFNRFPEFQKVCYAIRDSAKRLKADVAEGELMKLVAAGNVTAVIFALKKYNPEEFGDRGVDKPADVVYHELSEDFRNFLRYGSDENTEKHQSG